MPCQWVVIHRLENWKNRLRVNGHDRREPCGKRARAHIFRVGRSKVMFELCGAHRRAMAKRGVPFS